MRVELIAYSLLITCVNGFSNSMHALSLPQTSIRTSSSIIPLPFSNQVYSTIQSNKHVILVKKSTSLSSSSSTSGINDEKMNKKIQGRKKRVNAGYAISCLLFSIQALALMIKDKTPNGVYYASGPLMVSTITYILKGAANNNRLTSDTYKRLNLYMIQFGFISIVALLKLSTNHKLKFIPYFITMVNCIKGYGYGVKDWSLKKEGSLSFIQDFTNGCKNSIKTLFTLPKNIPSIGYFFMTITAGIWKLMKLIEIYYNYIGGSDNNILLKGLFQYNYYAILTAISFTLKDAADRNRLDGTTFIELNFIISFVWITMAGYFLSNLMAGSLPYYVGPAGVTLSGIFCMYNALISIRNKKQKSTS